MTSLVAALTVTPAVVYGMPRSQSAAKHIDLVMNILQAHFLNRGEGIYQAYSGFFSGVAWICDLAGVHSVSAVTAIATYWPFIIGLISIAELRFFFGRMVKSWYRIWIGVAAAFLVNSIGSDYFSPQSVGFALGIGVFALALGRDFPGLEERTRVALLVIAGCAMAVTHELSPYIVGGVLCLLVMFRVVWPRYLPATILAPAVVWAAVNKSVLSGFISLSALGDWSNFKPPQTATTPGLSRLAIVRESSDALALGLLLLIVIAAIGLLRNRRSLRPPGHSSCAQPWDSSSSPRIRTATRGSSVPRFSPFRGSRPSDFRSFPSAPRGWYPLSTVSLPSAWSPPTWCPHSAWTTRT